MSKSHPDKIAGDNPGREAITAAENRTREVRAAYEMLRSRRSIR
jgi:curved DNA-binding protein CbpA